MDDDFSSNELPLPEGKVKLVSGDGFEFIIDDDAARVSSTIRGMLDSQGKLLKILRFSTPLISIHSPFLFTQAISRRPSHARCISEKYQPEY